MILALGRCNRVVGPSETVILQDYEPFLLRDFQLNDPRAFDFVHACPVDAAGTK